MWASAAVRCLASARHLRLGRRALSVPGFSQTPARRRRWSAISATSRRVATTALLRRDAEDRVTQATSPSPEPYRRATLAVAGSRRSTSAIRVGCLQQPGAATRVQDGVEACLGWTRIIIAVVQNGRAEHSASRMTRVQGGHARGSACARRRAPCLQAAILVTADLDDGWLFRACPSSIVLNPVASRALRASARSWPWCSYARSADGRPGRHRGRRARFPADDIR